MRAWVVVFLVVLEGWSWAGPKPPEAFAKAMKQRTCDSTAWSRVNDDTWFAYCVEAVKDSESRKLATKWHRGVVFHHAASAATFERLALFEHEASQAIRPSDSELVVRVVVKGTALTVSSNGYTGESSTEVWDLATFPPRLVKKSYGGGIEWSHVNAPSAPACAVDLGRHRDACTWTKPACTDEPDDPFDHHWDTGTEVRFGTIPTVPDTTPHAVPPDPFVCAARYGDEASDAYFGKNPKHTTIEVVADDELGRKPAVVTLYLRAKDATPMLAAKPGVWQGADHWELWIGRAGNASATWRDDKAGYCAARLNEYVQLIVAPHADGTFEVANGAPKAKGSIAGATARTGPVGSVVVELTGTLAEWARDGAITASYSDSLDGKKQDTLIGSSRVTWGKPETFGRLGRDVMCHTSSETAPDTLPWQ